MSFVKKEWKNRLSENPVRRTLTPVDGGSAMVVDVTRNEGTVMQQGDPFNADNMNDLEQRIADGIGGGESIIAPTEQEESENAYAVGDKLIFDGVLYNVISPIAVGNTLVPGVNIQDTTASELIKKLEDEFTANNTRLYMDYKDGKYGVNTSSERGADTFIPFSQGLDQIYAALVSIGVTPASASAEDLVYAITHQTSRYRTIKLSGQGFNQSYGIGANVVFHISDPTSWYVDGVYRGDTTSYVTVYNG